MLPRGDGPRAASSRFGTDRGLPHLVAARAAQLRAVRARTGGVPALVAHSIEWCRSARAPDRRGRSPTPGRARARAHAADRRAEGLRPLATPGAPRARARSGGRAEDPATAAGAMATSPDRDR